MRAKLISITLGLSIPFLLLLLAAFALPAYTQGNDMVSIVPNDFDDNDQPLWDSSNLKASGNRSTLVTKTIEVYIPFEEYTYHYAIEQVNMSGSAYLFRLGNIQPPEAVQDIFFDWQGGSGCTLLSNNDVECGSGIEYFYLEFRYSYPHLPTSNIFTADTGSSSNFSTDRTSTLVYVAPLTFMTATLRSSGTPVAPDSHMGTTLQWIMLDTAAGKIDVDFYDPRVRIVYLPMIQSE